MIWGFVGEWLAPPGHFVKQNDISAGETYYFPSGNPKLEDNLGGRVKTLPYEFCL